MQADTLLSATRQTSIERACREKHEQQAADRENGRDDHDRPEHREKNLQHEVINVGACRLVAAASAGDRLLSNGAMQPLRQSPLNARG